jgi:hypothetical protein
MTLGLPAPSELLLKIAHDRFNGFFGQTGYIPGLLVPGLAHRVIMMGMPLRSTIYTSVKSTEFKVQSYSHADCGFRNTERELSSGSGTGVKKQLPDAGKSASGITSLTLSWHSIPL